MTAIWPVLPVSELESSGRLLVQDGNHGNDRPRPDEFVSEGTAFIRAADLRGGAIDFRGAGKITEVALARIRKGKGLPGDVLLSHKGTVGKVAFAQGDAPTFVCSPQTTFWRSLDLDYIDNHFLRYFLESPGFTAQLDARKGESDMAPYVSLTEQRKLRISIPPLTVQQSIAEVLGALDDKIAANTKLAASAFDLAGTLYDSNVSSASVRAMSEVLSPVLGGTPSRAETRFWDGDQLWASAKDVTGAEFGIINDTVERITALAVSTTKAKPLTAGSVILTARGTVGAVARLAKPSAFNQSCYGFVPDEIPAGVLYFSILRAAERAKAFAHGSVFDTITMKTFDHLYFPDLNGLEIARVEAIVSPILDVITAASLQNQPLVATRDALLPQLRSGKLRVRDAEKAVEAVV